MTKEIPPDIPGTPAATPHDSPLRPPDADSPPSPLEHINAAAALIRIRASSLPDNTLAYIETQLNIIRGNASLMDKHTLEAMTLAAELQTRYNAHDTPVWNTLRDVVEAINAILANAKLAQDTISDLLK